MTVAVMSLAAVKIIGIFLYLNKSSEAMFDISILNVCKYPGTVKLW